ncbi:hypothetical protein CFC21_101175 [Triticum aestivum]|uniref:Uncharacterized protein n=3 Tax=Triticum TaxID=4564 RepID=A0A9R1N3T6_WHEAT|nr:uncharacterized protein LOC123162436 [Triticum aestivum]KAF7099551.1 hypothetical protein CFC21_101174 [Triticum aestivum]KAF7099552.1 hypothetical protein CFC21_101175 [Triticum aestivum]VAI82886.1 unnamed protein product [Triticum turgidum subsp. durum]
MAGTRRGGALGAFTVAGKFNPVPEYALTFVRDYDIKGIGAMLAKASPCSMEEQIELFRKNVEQFRKPNAIGTFPNKGNAKDKEGEESDIEEEEGDYEVDEDFGDGMDEDEEILELMVDDSKPATDGQLQVHNEGERQCKKPRLAEEGFGWQGKF